MTPATVHHGRARATNVARSAVLGAAYAATPSGSCASHPRRRRYRRRRGSTSSTTMRLLTKSETRTVSFVLTGSALPAVLLRHPPAATAEVEALNASVARALPSMLSMDADQGVRCHLHLDRYDLPGVDGEGDQVDADVPFRARDLQSVSHQSHHESCSANTFDLWSSRVIVTSDQVTSHSMV